jgi:hypothetical protein
VEVTRRRAGAKEWVFLLNHTADEQKVAVSGKFKSVLSGETLDGIVAMKAFDVVALQKV